MSLKNLSAIILAAAALSSLLIWQMSKHQAIPSAPPRKASQQATIAPVTLAAGSNSPVAHPRSSVKHRASEFSASEKAEFVANFEGKYKPAIAKWYGAFNGHVPFAREEVTADRFVERIGINSAYGEYIFVVNGITLGVQDTKGTVQVDYLNAPQETKKMAVLPDGSKAPIVTMPITREEIVKALEAVSGTRFPAQEIRMTPSGLSGSLNGGVLANVGGTPENGASWKYDMVFGPDGKLAYYLKGNQ